MAHLLPLDEGRPCGCRTRRLPLNKQIMKTSAIPLGPAANTPGEILKEEFLIPLGLSLRETARRMGCGPMRLSDIVRGKRAVTAETSILLGKVLGVSPAFFLGLQMDHDLAKVAVGMRKKRNESGKNAFIPTPDTACARRELFRWTKARTVKLPPGMTVKEVADRYAKIVEWSEEDSCYVGRVPALGYGGVHGKDRLKVFNEICRVAEEIVAIQNERSRS